MSNPAIAQVENALNDFKHEGAIIARRSDGGLNLSIHGNHYTITISNSLSISGPGVGANEGRPENLAGLTKVVSSLISMDTGVAPAGLHHPYQCYDM